MSNQEQNSPTPPLYLRDVWLENAGPIEKLDLALPFNEDGTPKPLVIVGGNGAGKTILLSYIADALIEMAKTAFTDVVPGSEVSKPYFRINGGANQNSNAEFGLGILHFSDGQRHIVSVEKSGKCDSSLYNRKMTDYMNSGQIIGWPFEGNHKTSIGGDEKFYKDYFNRSSVCFFPANRSEAPHWVNRKSLFDENRFHFDRRFSNVLGKPIIIEQTSDQNKQWILDVILDSKIDPSTIVESMKQANKLLEQNQSTDSQEKFIADLNKSMVMSRSKINVEVLLSQVLRSAEVTLDIGPRSSASRLFVAKSGNLWLPSLDHLSAGQAILFNLFSTVIRYSDKNDLVSSIALQHIDGIVMIDEIDAHLHADLQHEVLPILMKLFPGVQFIVTTHSPLFLLGMEKTYGKDGFVILDMPSGQQITTERFAEFQKSYDYYKNTKTYENDLEQKLAQSNKPLVLTEGETDPKYIKAALELLGRADLLDALDIEWIGAQTPGRKGENFNSGFTALNNASAMMRANPDLTTRRVLLLYDCDTGKPSHDEGRLSVRAIPHNASNQKIKKGVENLLPLDRFEKRFYNEQPKVSDYGEESIICKFDKMKFCNYICDERREVADFAGFSVIVDILEEFFAPSIATS